MDAEERLRLQMDRANAEAIKSQEEYEEERKRMESIDDHTYDLGKLLSKMSNGVRGGSK